MKITVTLIAVLLLSYRMVNMKRLSELMMADLVSMNFYLALTQGMRHYWLASQKFLSYKHVEDQILTEE
uniref:Uncharacterized protein n=1 Tax=Acrobeloides nanus TaxID=290746 RepID=A0A914DD13_9BILA